MYFDTSAFLPILIPEVGSAPSHEIWERASGVVSTRLLFVESTAALVRLGRETESAKGIEGSPVPGLIARWEDFRIIELGEQLMFAAASFAARFGLRGYDAVHCAAAASIKGPDTVAASSDQRLLAAWSELGLATFDPRR